MTKFRRFAAAAVFTAFVAILVSPRLVLQDLSIYWRAGALWLDGGSPYVLPHQSTYLDGVYGSRDVNERTLAVWTPPYFLGPMMLFSPWTLSNAKRLYGVIASLTALGWASRAALGAGDERSTVERVVLLAAMPWFAWGNTVTWGGMSVLSAAAWLLVARFGLHSSVAGWAAFFSLLSLKAHPSWLALLVLFAVAPAPARRAMAGGAIATGAVLAVPLLATPGLVREFATLDYSTPSVYRIGTYTVAAVLIQLGAEGWLATLIPTALGLVVVGLAFVHRRRLREGGGTAAVLLSLPISVLLSPYSWRHDYIVCSGAPAALAMLPGISDATRRSALVAAATVNVIYGTGFVAQSTGTQIIPYHLALVLIAAWVVAIASPLFGALSSERGAGFGPS